MASVCFLRFFFVVTIRVALTLGGGGVLACLRCAVLGFSAFAGWLSGAAIHTFVCCRRAASFSLHVPWNLCAVRELAQWSSYIALGVL